jgi:hypothetical protein
MTTPKECGRCGRALDGWSQERYVNGKFVEVLCASCSDAEEIKSYRETSVLTKALTMTAALAYGRPKDSAELRDVRTAVARLRLEIKTWEAQVWFAGLQREVLAAEFRGFRMDFPGGIALVYSLAGRTQITLATPDESGQVSLITSDNETESVMGLNSIRATEAEALGLVVCSRDAFLGGMRFQRDDKVGIGL